MEFISSNWTSITAICMVIAAIVVFGKNLAELILKWKEVFKSKGATIISKNSITSSTENSTFDSVIKGNIFEANIISENNGNSYKTSIKKSGEKLTFREVLDFWENDIEFVDFYLSLFNKYGFASYIWETPPLSTNSLDQIFEFVILNMPKSSQNPDLETFSDYFNKNMNNHGVVTFLNLGHDAMLVVPSPLRDGINYSGLAEFFTNAPLSQQRALWKVTAHQIKMKLSNRNTWVSVAGGGVSWLHIRLDDKPKYYRYAPYISAPNKPLR